MQQPLPPPPIADPFTRVELTVSAKNLRDEDLLSKSDPLCILYMQEFGSDHFYEAGRTELIKNDLNPNWAKKFELDYRFEERQILKFHVYDWDTKSNNPHEQDSLGCMECSLAEIMSERGSYTKALTKKGMLSVRGEELSSSKEVVTLQFLARGLDKKDFFGKSDPFLQFSRSTESNEYIIVYKTDVVKNNLNPIWKRMTIPVRNLCRGDYECSIKIECFDYDDDGSHDLIGECFTNLRALKESQSNLTYSLINNKKKAKKKSYKDSGKLILESCNFHVEYSFLDYIQNGLQMHFTVAVDFTASNGNPSDRNSLHYREPGVDNQYSTAIKSVGEIIQDYDSDKMFPALGFGARIPPAWEVSHEFFLSGSSDNPYCHGVEGILHAYDHALQTVRLYGPTNFSPVIRHVMQFAKNFQDGKNYFVLLIITDGLITDMNQTKEALIEASQYPMSVIIVGVGNENFSAMDVLDADNKRLSSGGLYAQRDIVQFVELKRHFTHARHSSSVMTCHKASLAKDVLAEVPYQVISWMKSRNFSP